MDTAFGEDYLNCFHQVSRSWRVPNPLLSALIGDFGLTRGLGSTMPVSLSDDDYVSLAASFFASETGESGGTAHWSMSQTCWVHRRLHLAASHPAPGLE